MKVTQNNAFGYAMQLCGEMAMLALHEAFGFGTERITRFLSQYYRELQYFHDNVNWEFDSETVQMRCREREQKRPDLTYTMEQIDERIRQIVPPDAFKPYNDRYGGYGGRVSWAK